MSEYSDPMSEFMDSDEDYMMDEPSTTNTTSTSPEYAVNQNGVKQIVPESTIHAPEPSGILQQVLNKKIQLFISKRGIPITTNDVAYNVESQLRKLGFDKSTPLEVHLPTSFYTDYNNNNQPDLRKIEKIKDLLQMVGVRAIESSVSHRNVEASMKVYDGAIFLWNGSDNEVARLIDSYRYMKFHSTFQKVDPKLGSMWSHAGNVDAICVATNGYYKSYKNNKVFATCGMGSALQAKILIPTIPEILGNKLKQFGNKVQSLTSYEHTQIIAFPTKPEYVVVAPDKSNIPEYCRNSVNVNDQLPGYRGLSDKALINKSFTELAHFIQIHQLKSVIIPRVGCGSGGLNWENDIVPMILANEAIRQHTDIIFVAKYGAGRIPLRELLG
jgi:hypothetical protein